MTYSEEGLWSLLREAEDLPFGADRTALVEQVITEADAAGYRHLAFHARMSGTTGYLHGAEPAKSVATFAWCLAEYDRHPDDYEPRRLDLLWQFKGVVGALLSSPDTSLSRIDDVLADMAARWRAGGHSPHAVYSLRHLVASHTGDEKAAEYWYGKWLGSPRDELSDCAACDPGRQARWLTSRRRYAEAIQVAEPVLDGRATCSEQPQGVLTDLLEPYLREGALAEARDAHRRAYRRLRSTVACMTEVADHLWFCAVTGNVPRGVDLVERHLPWLDEPPTPLADLRFTSRAALVLRRASEQGAGQRRLRRPGHGNRPAGDVTVTTLATELVDRAVELAARFDARNGTGHQGAELRRILDAAPIVTGLPLVPQPPRRVAPSQRRPTTAEVPAGAQPDDLLERAEQQYRQGGFTIAYATWQAFDERFATEPLNALQRARRADGYALETANAGDLPAAETAWRSALALYAEAGDELRRQIARGRLGLAYCVTGRGETGLPMVEEATSYVLAHGGPDRRAGAFMSLSAAYGAVGRHEDGLAALERAEEYVPASPDPHVGIRLVIDRAQHHGALGHIDESREAAAEAARHSREVDFREGLARASWLLGLAAEYQQDHPGAIAAYDEALTSADDPPLARQIRRQRAGLLAASARAEEAIEDLVDIVGAETAAGDTTAAGAAQHQLAIAYLNAGRYLDAAETAEEAVAGLDAAGDPHAHAVRHLLATAELRLGQPDDAIAVLEIVEAYCLSVDNPAGAAQMAEEIGDVLDRVDRDAAAAARFATAADRYHQAGLVTEAVRARRRHATSLLWAHDLPGALAALERADLTSAELPADDPAATWERGMLGYDGAKILSQDGRVVEGAVRAAAAATRFRGIGALTEAAHTEALRGELLLQAEQPADAERALRRALADLPELDTEDIRRRMADLLAEALVQQGRTTEAAAVRAAHGLPGALGT